MNKSTQPNIAGVCLVYALLLNNNVRDDSCDMFEFRMVIDKKYASVIRIRAEYQLNYLNRWTAIALPYRGSHCMHTLINFEYAPFSRKCKNIPVNRL